MRRRGLSPDYRLHYYPMESIHQEQTGNRWKIRRPDCCRTGNHTPPSTSRPPSCPVGSRRSILGRNGDSRKCVLVRRSLSRPCLSREREVCVCVLLCVFCVPDSPNRRHQMAAKPEAAPPFIPCVSLCLSTSVSLQMVLCFPPF